MIVTGSGELVSKIAVTNTTEGYVMNTAARSIGCHFQCEGFFKDRGPWDLGLGFVVGYGIWTEHY